GRHLGRAGRPRRRGRRLALRSSIPPRGWAGSPALSRRRERSKPSRTSPPPHHGGGLPPGRWPVFVLRYFTQEICVINWSIEASAIAALVAYFGPELAGNVASVASPTRNTLKSRDRFW